MEDSCWYCTEVCCRFLFGTWCLVLYSEVDFLKDATFSRCVLACLSSASSIRCRRRFRFTLMLARDADEYLCTIHIGLIKILTRTKHYRRDMATHTFRILSLRQSCRRRRGFIWNRRIELNLGDSLHVIGAYGAGISTSLQFHPS